MDDRDPAGRDHNDATPKQACNGVPGNSVSEIGERMNGGAVKEERSPENDAILRRRQELAWDRGDEWSID